MKDYLKQLPHAVIHELAVIGEQVIYSLTNYLPFPKKRLSAEEWRQKQFELRHDLEALHRYGSSGGHIERPMPRFPVPLPDLRFVTPGLHSAMPPHPMIPPHSAYLRHLYPQQLSPRLPHPSMLPSTFPAPAPHSSSAAHHLPPSSSVATSFASAHAVADSNHYLMRHRSRFADDMDIGGREALAHNHHHQQHHHNRHASRHHTESQSSYHHQQQQHSRSQHDSLVPYSADSNSPPCDVTPPSGKHLLDSGQDELRHSSGSSSSLISVGDRSEDICKSVSDEHQHYTAPAGSTHSSESTSPSNTSSSLAPHTQQQQQQHHTQQHGSTAAATHSQQHNSEASIPKQRNTVTAASDSQPTAAQQNTVKPPPDQQSKTAEKRKKEAVTSSSSSASSSSSSSPSTISSSEPKPSLLLSELTSTRQLPSIAKTIEQVQNAYRELLPILKRVSASFELSCASTSLQLLALVTYMQIAPLNSHTLWVLLSRLRH